MVMEELHEWTADANKALSVTLVRSAQDALSVIDEDPEARALLPFNPAFTYPIFGEKEKIYGYKGLQVEVNMVSGSLKQYLNVTYDEKLESQADDIEGTLFKFIPSDYTKSAEIFADTVAKDAESFVPPGTQIASYRSADDEEDDVEYGVWHCKWDTPGFREFHRRAQLFVLLYIEGGSYIQEDEDQWEFLILFEIRPHDTAPTGASYHFAGYVSAYPFWCYPDMVRMRLSQFVILPPFQGQGHGSQLYNTLYDYASTLEKVAELTVEDPSEAFEDLRDRCDLVRLKEQLKDSKEMAKGAPVDKKWLEKIRTEGKYATRQFLRLIEMLLLERLKTNRSPERYKAYRLQVKERLFRFNYEILAQISPDERREKLAETYKNVEEDYKRILNSLRPVEQDLWEWIETPQQGT
ncbi:histone acetyltransferase type B catalytic subunit [Filobasidium floriforme]|uniref:histone acetyltransferase type B catalytic subunit n=1 Tax=Filobasidium floriforme TaxID=5210 RepID=UPI001E8E2766|nr:histone acetyltransferase type B catalytic subunit [Filobasidium floriforme]KAH8090348.1 histone acetyltransferase type B catalytic subunit [Filobasidium floriforme]